MTSELQNIIDDLADRLNSPTVLEDHEERMVVYSSHSQPVDKVRRDSILRRTTRREVKDWFRQHGILTATEPMRIPGQPDQGVLGRLCAPVRYQGRLMGWLFLIDDEQRLDDAGIMAVRQAADHAALLLYQEELAARLTTGSLTHLLSPADELRESAAEQIADQGLMPARSPCVIAVIQPLGQPDRATRESVSEALRDAARAVPGGYALGASLADHGVVLARARTIDDDLMGVSAAREVCAAMRRRTRNDLDPQVVAAVGDPQPRLRDAYLSYRQARLAAKVAAVVPGVGDIARWRDLGVFRTLAQLPEAAAESALDPRVSALFTAEEPDLVATLETYLDLGCDAKSTAARLHLHRATLYYRLDKANRLTGANLRDGHDRLAIHLGFKLARLTGLHPYAGGQPPARACPPDCERPDHLADERHAGPTRERGR